MQNVDLPVKAVPADLLYVQKPTTPTHLRMHDAPPQSFKQAPDVIFTEAVASGYYQVAS